MIPETCIDTSVLSFLLAIEDDGYIGDNYLIVYCTCYMHF